MGPADLETPADYPDDPYPYYSRLRTEDPVHLNRAGVWILTRYEDVALVLRDPCFGRKGFADLLATDTGASMLLADPPTHTRLRALAAKAFTLRLIEGLRPYIQQVVDSLLDRIRDGRAVDLIADFACPLPVCVISELLGVPAADRDQFRQWSVDVALSPACERVPSAYDAITSYFRRLIAERRKRPGADLLTALIAAGGEQDKLNEFELLDICGLLFVAGHETTINLIGNGMLALLQHPPELRKLRENPELLPVAVEELLRYDSPVQRAGRVANIGVRIGGKMIPRGTVVFALLGAANRDPAQFPQPDRLDIARRDNRHLAFGRGERFCLGAPLARVEAQIAFGALMRRLPNLELATDRIEWRKSSEVRALKELRVTFN
jgi:pimeloyl-[acyl-carrier protein] synthase